MDLAASLDNIDRKGIPEMVRARVPRLRSVAHLPSLRPELTACLLYALRPERAVLFCTPAAARAVRGMGLERLWRARGVRPVSLRFVGLPEPGREHGRAFVDFALSVFRRERLTPASALVDLTGGTKLHSIGLYKAATALGLGCCYLRARERREAGGIAAVAGGEELVLFRGEADPTVFSIDAFTDLSVSVRPDGMTVKVRRGGRVVALTRRFERQVLAGLVRRVAEAFVVGQAAAGAGCWSVVRSRLAAVASDVVRELLPEGVAETLMRAHLARVWLDRGGLFVPWEEFVSGEGLLVRDFEHGEEARPSFGEGVLVVVGDGAAAERRAFEEEAEAVRSVAAEAGHGVRVTRRPEGMAGRVWKAVHYCGHGVVRAGRQGLRLRGGVVERLPVRAEVMTVNACLSAPVFGVRAEELAACRFLASGGAVYVGTLFPVPLEVSGFGPRFYGAWLRGEHAGDAFRAAASVSEGYAFFGNPWAVV